MFDTHDLAVLIRSGAPLILIETQEEALLKDALRHVVAEVMRPLWRWKITDGLLRLDMDDLESPPCRDSAQVLEFMHRNEQRAIWLLLDFHPYLRYAMNVRRLREIALGQAAARHTVILAGGAFGELPPELAPLITRYEIKLPDDAAIGKLMREEAFSYSREHGGKRVEVDAEAARALQRHLRGLTLSDVRSIVRRLIHHDGAISSKDIAMAQQAKFELLGKDAVLHFEPDAAQFDQVAGLGRLKAWIEMRRRVFVEGKAPKGLDPPKGVLMVGVQGAGKSLAAKATAGGFGVPLLRLDFGALYNKYHGETERNLRAALKTAEAMAPCVLWCDEIEKGLATGSSDDGVSQRVLGALLTWMSERKTAVFLVATANNIDRLPPEFLRKGRFDEVFFVDLPSEQARGEVFRIHFKRRDLNVADFELDALVAASEGFSGAEIEQAIVAALYAAWNANRGLLQSDVIEALRGTRPLSVMMSEQVARLRAWAAERCVPAD